MVRVAEGVYMCGKDKGIWGCVLERCPFVFNLVEPFCCMVSIDFGVCPPESVHLHPFCVCHSLLWRVKIGESVYHVHKPWGNVVKLHVLLYWSCSGVLGVVVVLTLYLEAFTKYRDVF